MKTKFQSFTYTKENGDQSDRWVAITATPTSNVHGIDLTELSAEELEAFMEEYEVLKQKQKQEFDTLLKQFELQNKYRQFKPEGISNKQEL